MADVGSPHAAKENESPVVPIEEVEHRGDGTEAENLGLVLEALSDGISIHSCDGSILRANRHLAGLYGLELRDLVGRGCSDLFHQDEQECTHEEVVRNLKEAEITLAREDRIFRITLTPIVGEDLMIRGYLRLMRDVTLEQRTRKELLRAARITTLEQMISGMAHDIGTPLGIISGYAEYLLMKTKIGEPGRKELNTILQQTRRVSESVQQMIDLVRAPQNRIDAISLSGFLSEVTDLVKHHLKKLSVGIALSSSGEPPLIYGSAPRLKQALFNLMLQAGARIGLGGRLQLDLGEGPPGENPFARVVLSGATAQGQPFDFGPAFSTILSEGRSGETVSLGPSVLSLTTEILESFGAELSLSAAAGQCAALVIDLPANSPAPIGSPSGSVVS
jgi:two-component system, NtrC family, sensor histidine kinase HydH